MISNNLDIKMNRKYENKKSKNTGLTACSKAVDLRLTRRRHRAYAERRGGKISDFTTLGNNANKTSYGFSYTKTTTIVESYKTFLGIKIPDKTRTETATYYMTVNRDKNDNASFQIYNSEEEYKKATSNW
ncbi:hypothetical protein AGMMS49965_23760 [Bacteroidia bacterium]|nr:hypothetical protein AGMMS49965_23760 [Bacteroidia bacterium]